MKPKTVGTQLLESVEDATENPEGTQTAKPNHTPTPWKYEHEELLGANDFVIAVFDERECFEDRINARHIVHCVNMHDELVEALRYIASYPDEDGEHLAWVAAGMMEKILKAKGA